MLLGVGQVRLHPGPRDAVETTGVGEGPGRTAPLCFLHVDLAGLDAGPSALAHSRVEA